MLKTLLNAVGLLACLAWLNIASAANMGGINVSSALGHPLKAEILLAELGENDRSAVVAKMASVNEYKSAGMDYPYSIPKLNFEIDPRANGETYLKITSTQPVNEPFVSLLIELSWPSGKLLREYTFLLDPAGFVPEQPKVAEVKPVEPMVPVPEPAPAVIPVPVPMPEAALPVASAPAAEPEIATLPAADEGKEVVAQSAPEAAKTQQLPVETAKAEAVVPAPQAVAATSLRVEKGDTLGKIADEVKPVDVSLERMLVALYRANAKTFDGKNMNRIKAGKILRMPELDEIAKISQAAAVKEIRAQVADWQDYRQRLAAAQVDSAEQAPKQEAAGKISAAVAEKSPATKETAREVLKLSKGESLGDKTIAGGGAKGKQEKLADNADDAAAKKKQLQEEQKKIAKLEDINKEVSKLVELKGRPAAANGADAKLPASAPAAVTARKKLSAASAVAAAKPAVEEPGILDSIGELVSTLPDDPMLLGGIAALLGLGGLGSVLARRKKAGQKKSSDKNEPGTKKSEDIGSATGSWRTPVVPSPETGDFTQVAASPQSAPMSDASTLDDVDPISEADLFLNFGRDAQAEEILKDALSNNPSNMQAKLKLLSIYSNRKDTISFSRYAQEVKDSGDEAAWERAAVMGREIDPDNPNYGGIKGEVRQRETPKPEVDFDLGFAKPAAPAPATDAADASKDYKMDFDVTEIQSPVDEMPIDLSAPFAKPAEAAYAKSSADVDATSILTKADVTAAQAATPMDFDVSGFLPAEDKKSAAPTEMDFDLSGVLPEEVKPSTQPLAMDFDLSGNIEAGAAATPAVPPAIQPATPALNFDDLVFEIPASQPEPVQETRKAAADAGMEFTIDFQTSGTTEPPPAKPEAAKKLDIDFGDININLGEDLPPVQAGGEGKGEQWHEVATKLDLAKAYQEMGDVDGAREILEEVTRDGDETQREAAEKLLQQIAP